MNKRIQVPASLHEVFGESQSVGELAATLLFGLGLAVGLFLWFPEMTRDLPLWRSGLAFLVILDVFAGSAANFTRSTNDYYAARGKLRLVFIAIHVHLLVIAWLVGIPMGQAFMAWGYTILGAYVVNAFHGSQYQRFVAGLLLCGGIAFILMVLDFPRYFLVISLLFLVKILYSFAVDHYSLK